MSERTEFIGEWRDDSACVVCGTMIGSTFPTNVKQPWVSSRKWYRDSDGVWCGECNRFEDLAEAEEFWESLPDDTDPEEQAREDEAFEADMARMEAEERGERLLF